MNLNQFLCLGKRIVNPFLNLGYEHFVTNDPRAPKSGVLESINITIYIDTGLPTPTDKSK